MKKIHKEKGFTLIELLVVIAIIAILSTVVMAGLNSARAKGRDAARIASVKQVQAALELFFDTCGGYPTAVSWATLPASATGGIACPAATTFATFMPTMPVYPTPVPAVGGAYTYVGGVGGATYTLTFGLEQKSGALLGGVLHTASPSGII